MPYTIVRLLVVTFIVTGIVNAVRRGMVLRFVLVRVSRPVVLAGPSSS